LQFSSNLSVRDAMLAGTVVIRRYSFSHRFASPSPLTSPVQYLIYSVQHFDFSKLPMLISVGLGPYRQTPLLQGSPRLYRQSMPIRVFSRSAHVAGLVILRQPFVRRCHGGWLGSDLVNEGGIPRSADYFRDNFKPI
jgi:hypothetical protein